MRSGATIYGLQANNQMHTAVNDPNDGIFEVGLGLLDDAKSARWFAQARSLCIVDNADIFNSLLSLSASITGLIGPTANTAVSSAHRFVVCSVKRIATCRSAC